MNGLPVNINSRQDVLNLLDDPEHRDQALAFVQALLDEQYGYGESGAWMLVGGGGLDRLGITRAEAVEMGAVDQVIGKPPAPAVDGLIVAACARIDAMASAICDRIITPGSSQMARYQRKESQARAYLGAQAAGTLATDAATLAATYPAVIGEVGITAETPEAVARVIVDMADAWWSYGDAVEAARLAGKRSVEAAGTPAAVAAAEAAIVWPVVPE